MSDDGRSPPSTLKGRLADVYVPALVSGALEALSRRLGNRATIDDPLCGRASSLASIDPLLARVSEWLASGGASYFHVGSTTGVDRDAAEGRLAMTLDGAAREIPIVVVAERRRLREIELRVYYTSGDAKGKKARAPIAGGVHEPMLQDTIASIVGGLRSGSVETVLADFEEAGRVVDPSGAAHEKRDGGMATFLSGLGALGVELCGAADDGRTCCVEATVTRRAHDAVPAVLSFERGDSGLVREMRAYW